MIILHYTKEEIEEEQAIIERAKSDPNVFGFLYEKYFDAIFLFINRRVDDADTAGDLCSQVFLKALNKLVDYQHKGLPFSAWLYRIASNQVNEHFRNVKKQRSISVAQDGIERLFAEVEQEESVTEDDLTPLLLQLLQQLDEKEVELLELRFFEGHSIKEVAYILGITKSNAKVKIFRLLEKMRKKAAKLLVFLPWLFVVSFPQKVLIYG